MLGEICFLLTLLREKCQGDWDKEGWNRRILFSDRVLIVSKFGSMSTMRFHLYSPCSVAQGCAAHRGGGREGKGLSVLCPHFTVPMDCLWALRYGLFKQLSHCGGDTGKPTALHWAHTLQSPCPESLGRCFHLALGTVSSWAAVSTCHWSKEGLVTTRAGTRMGMAEESHGMGQQAEHSH